MITFIYLCILLFIIIFCLYLINLSSKRCPSKIKLFYKISLCILLIKCFSLLSSWLLESQKSIYFIKVFTQLNLLGIPLLALVTFYIFLRDENKKFDYNYIFMTIIIIVYCVLNMVYKLDIKIDSKFGFVVSYSNTLVPSLVYLIFLSIIIVQTIFFLDKPYNNSIGMKLLLCSLIVLIVEFIVYLGGIRIFPYPLIGEIFILGSSFKAIGTFKKT